jgi:hypothetical protein
MNVKVYIFFLQARELGKVRRELEVSGRIQTSSLEDDDEDMWLEQDSSFKASGRTLCRFSSWLRPDVPPSGVSRIDTDSNLSRKRPVYVRGSTLVSTCGMM